MRDRERTHQQREVCAEVSVVFLEVTGLTLKLELRHTWKRRER